MSAHDRAKLFAWKTREEMAAEYRDSLTLDFEREDMEKVMKFKEPMLACNEPIDLDKVLFPKLASYKMDGMRCCILEGSRAVTRTLTPIPNDYTRTLMLEAGLPAGLDGELGILGNDGAMDFRASMSALRSKEGEPEFRFYIFDNFNYDGAFLARFNSLVKMKLERRLPEWCIIADQIEVVDAQAVREMYAKALDLGHEGLILREQDAPYKCGRSTANEQWMLKMKPWEDAEGVITRVEQKMKNTNARERDARGHAKRSGAMVGKVPVEAVGALWVKSDKFAEEFKIGGGWDSDMAQAWWKHSPVGQVVTFKYAATGNYDKPRHAQFKGFRALEDL